MSNHDIYKTSTYYYDLPERLIAQTPIEPRDHSRLLVYHKDTNTMEHKHFYDIVDYFKAGDVLVINNTKVIPARIYGIKEETGAKIEVLLLKRHNLTDWEVVMKPGKRAKIGTKIVFNENLYLTVLEDLGFGKKKVSFTFNGVFEDILSNIGSMPLPPYIKEKLKDKARYNTVYSKIDGSAAAPTAGLHFTKELLDKLRGKGVIICEVLLHVGLGTFRPVSEENILNHDMHTEYIEVTKETADVINKAKAEGRRVIACGTTSIRTLESASETKGVITPCKKETNIFIYPGYDFKIVDAVITNFHLPESTLIMLVSAFLGIDNTLKMYKTAVEEEYRFFSFGDATLLI
ncbi:MAG: tRNA preQ1(34) S-adenosylmethionine ribosyltransferase-isomerase QueA [Clostridia bacterium]|nr:tRNA preQ1(34) S-adenosylmethionine ribosyltransferase-isomerase QueA [Clostridia bacterium]